MIACFATHVTDNADMNLKPCYCTESTMLALKPELEWWIHCGMC